MFKRQFLIFSVLIFLSFSCQDKPEKYGSADVDVNEIGKDVVKWYQYHYYYIHLDSDFRALDQDLNDISKRDFLKKLTTGKYLAARLHSVKGTTYYQLFKLGEESDNDISQAIKSLAKTELDHFEFEGKSFPEFRFKDLAGNIYDNVNTKGKVLVLKTWFINCSPCIKEMPAVNFLKKKYANEDALFIGLTFDKEDDLLEFKEKVAFDYNIVSVDSKFIHDTLGVNQYPSHIIVDREGKISKLMNDSKSLRKELERIFEK